MKKKLLLLLSCGAFVLASNKAEAQLADGSVAPNFTMVDINGNSHTLYDYLDAGKSVVMDVSATWCGPCWNYHNTHALKDTYDAYGPAGTNEMMVFYVEGDQSTTLADLQGTGGNTQGDWVTGTPYPIIDDDGTINNAYAIGYFPTIYLICPNRIVKEVGQKTAAQIYAETGNCKSATTSNDPSLLLYTGDNMSCAAVTAKVKLQNMGTSALTSCTIEVKDGSTVLATKNWTGNLATYEVEEVTIGSVALSGTVNASIVISSTDDDASNNTISKTLTYVTTESSTSAVLTIVPDKYGSEITWKLKKSSGATVSAGGPYTDGNTNAITKNLTLTDGECYTFTIYDSYGDGICCAEGNGSYSIVSNGVTIASGAEYTTDDVKGFKANAVTGIVESAKEPFTVSISPNPVVLNADVEFSLEKSEIVKIYIYNSIGEQVALVNKGSLNAGKHNLKVDVSGFSSGVYFMNLTAGDITSTSKFNIVR